MFLLQKTNLSEFDKQELKKDILNLFNEGKWCMSAPWYQTWPTLFENEDSHWLKVKQSFDQAVKPLVNNNIFKTRCWAYVNFPNRPILDAESSWHEHRSSYNTDSVISACYYLNLPTGSFTTEYKEEDQILNMPYQENSWTLFPGQLVHRSGKWNAETMQECRIVLAADCIY